LLKEWSQPAARHAEVRRVLDLVGLSDLGSKRIRAMSGGQRRRVSLAQALLGSPPVLILDEPTTGVDPEQRVTLRTVLAELARTSIVVLSTHQTEDVAALCERVIVLDLDPEVPAERTGIRRQLGYQPQEVGFPRGFTAFAFVDYIALLKEWTQPAARHKEVRRVLDLVGLSDLGSKRIRAMSGGQRRRVTLAQALLGSPAVLILDEPTTGVDPEQRVTLRTVLAEIARTSIVVLSTHQTEDVAALCERVIVLDRGRVRYDGPVTDLTGQAAGRVWLADEPDPAAKVSWRTGTGRYRNVGAHVRDDVEHVEPSLEDAYLLLRGGSPQDEPAAEVAS
ncbi:MAG TPA: ATP-binding cassette domain-containing protein, partial [Streptosporangiaceae bacterium]|nr:ATP-binding cassette domain-containing protein [Streptosporangiaceae bacterium]